MKNTERQKKLDLKKWFASIEAGKDMGGKMDYCEGCQKLHPIGDSCNATQADRENLTLCATNYNRLDKKNRSKKK